MEAPFLEKTKLIGMSVLEQYILNSHFKSLFWIWCGADKLVVRGSFKESAAQMLNKAANSIEARTKNVFGAQLPKD